MVYRNYLITIAIINVSILGCSTNNPIDAPTNTDPVVVEKESTQASTSPKPQGAKAPIEEVAPQFSELRHDTGVIAYDLLEDPLYDYEKFYGRLAPGVRYIRYPSPIGDGEITVVFNRLGQIVKELSEGGIKNYEVSYEYDRNSIYPTREYSGAGLNVYERDQFGNILKKNDKRIMVREGRDRYVHFIHSGLIRYYRDGWVVREESRDFGVDKYTYKFDSEGNIIERNKHHKSALSDYHKRETLDDRGNLLMEMYEGQDRIDELSYKFDSRGNWISRTRCGNAKYNPSKCTTLNREIQYW